MAYHRTAVSEAHNPSGRKLRCAWKMQQRCSSICSNVLWSLKGRENETFSDLVSARAATAGEYFTQLSGGPGVESTHLRS
jgi:hypothetical protein